MEGATEKIFEFKNATVEASSNLLEFSWIDYLLFCAMFGLSAVIGVYFGCFGSKQSSIKDYLLGGKSMSIIPIAMSLTASNVSGITMLGMPAEIYIYGTQFWACVFCACVTTVVMMYVFLPVFHKLQLNSSYEYLQIRFDKSIRNMASFIFLINTLLYVPIVIYIPAIAFNQVTGVDIYYVTPIVCVICIFYTTLGGLKAVVWTDTLQFSITVISMMAVLTIGTIEVGGFGPIWKHAEESGRIEFFNMNLDFTDRSTFWGIIIGVSFLWISHYGVHQASIQRYLALPTMKSANKACILFGVGVIITKSISCFSGLIMYAKYIDCDPLTSGKVKRMDQLVPYYVLDVAGKIPGLSGVFVSGVFSTALSTMSTSLNTMAGTIYEDFLLPNNLMNVRQKSGSGIVKTIVVILGLISVALVFIVDKLSGAMQIGVSVNGITGGPVLGIFSLGILFPYANTKGAYYGSLVSFAFVSWMCFGQQFSNVKATMKKFYKPLSLAGCDNNTTLFNVTTNIPPEPFWLYRVSHYWYALIGFLLTIVIGLIISKLTKPPKHVKKDLLSPAIYRLLPKDYEVEEYEPVPLKAIDKSDEIVEQKLNNIVRETEMCKNEFSEDHGMKKVEKSVCEMKNQIELNVQNKDDTINQNTVESKTSFTVTKVCNDK